MTVMVVALCMWIMGAAAMLLSSVPVAEAAELSSSVRDERDLQIDVDAPLDGDADSAADSIEDDASETLIPDARVVTRRRASARARSDVAAPPIDPLRTTHTRPPA